MGIENWFKRPKTADQLAEELAAASRSGADDAAMGKLADELIRAVKEGGGK